MTQTPWSATVLTLFPEMFPGPLGLSLSGKALMSGIWSMKTVNIRDFAADKHNTVDDTPFGGGPGMVMRPDVVDAALASVEERPGPIVYLSPRGKVFNQAMAAELAEGDGVTLLCGRYEGIDQRVLDKREIREVSLGDFVLSGGELAAMALLDACLRLLPGYMGAEASLEEESFSAGLLEYPHFTRPATWDGMDVPAVLLSGHHEKIKAWRQAEAERTTRTRRPDLWSRYCTTKGAGMSAN
ncbi:tRNA (guanosine(37)-N1)-methyltransferase TrmD [Hwanghaeella sp.]|uniref:tRNA (guanosine(37)-N1)-methyltransferase TrmD n=1 Tax=Hwanghaeella sp. TaxID=2605943 RepID=UPI003CCBFFFD